AVSPTVVLREAYAPPPTDTAWTGSPSARSACTASLPAGWLPAAACVRPGAVAGDRRLPGAALGAAADDPDECLHALVVVVRDPGQPDLRRSEEHTSELQ